MALTWLHLSDLAAGAHVPYSHEVMLRALIDSVDDLRARGWVPDHVFVTGDITDSGTAADYDHATAYLDELLNKLELGRGALHAVPGDRDVNRHLGVGLARTLASVEESDTYFAPAFPRQHMLQKQQEFRASARFSKHEGAD
jgi:3',5'-cyclic AMP phosphodiesterase CpdA